MAGRDMLVMSLKEVKRLKAVQSAIDGQITQKMAGWMIGISPRQVRRLMKAVREAGERGIIHGLRGRRSNRKFPEELRRRVISLYQERYWDFGPTLAMEKLEERDGIKVSEETLRKWLIEAELWKRKRKRTVFRQWRPRKGCFGQMVQIDGSYHDWLEGRGPALVLMGYIDDATSTVYGRFYDYEGTLPAMDSFKRYVRKYGLPMSIYVDKHTTYKSPKRCTEWEEDEGNGALSQFERALGELGVEIIHALSPQAKGRVERLFGVLQDRLIKEMRLQDIRTKEEANAFLEEYLPVYNKKFGVPPVDETDVHVRLPREVDLDAYLCIKKERTVDNVNTVSHETRLFQLKERGSKKVIVEERLDGSLRIVCRGVSLEYTQIMERPKKKTVPKTRARESGRSSKPAKDHPWKRSWKNWMPAHQQWTSTHSSNRTFLLWRE